MPNSSRFVERLEVGAVDQRRAFGLQADRDAGAGEARDYPSDIYSLTFRV
jgi:hypothetical protein